MYNNKALKLGEPYGKEGSVTGPFPAALFKPGDKGPAPVLYRHAGHSMDPTLCELDLLEIEPYGNRPVRVGDVIIFLPPGLEEPVVHRIIRHTSGGICTRGDSNQYDDPWNIETGDILGQVTAAWRGQKRRNIAGGERGRLTGLLIRIKYAPDKTVSGLLGPVYRSLARSGILRCGFFAFLKPRILVFQSGSCTNYQLLVGKRVVGRYNPSGNRWDIKRPFKLFVDESSLPPNPSD